MYGKIIPAQKLSQELQMLRNMDLDLVFTNGCFDILHPGHAEYLSAAKTLGDFLIVGINSDASVKKLKGNSRPINSLEDRMAMLAALQSVDMVVAFDEETPIKLIKEVKPLLLVKGGDYKKEDIVGASFVESNGGKVEIIPLKDGHSSTALIDKIKKL